MRDTTLGYRVSLPCVAAVCCCRVLLPIAIWRSKGISVHASITRASVTGIFNFHSNVRPVPLEMHIQGFDIAHVPSRLLAMSKPAYYSVVNHARDKPAIVFVPSAKQAELTAVDLLTYATADDTPKRFLHANAEDVAPFLRVIKAAALQHTVAYGIGFLHEGLSAEEQRAVCELHASGAIQVLVVTHSMCWGLSLQCHLAVLMDTQYYDGAEHRYTNYPITDILQMVGRACRYLPTYSPRPASSAPTAPHSPLPVPHFSRRAPTTVSCTTGH